MDVKLSDDQTMVNIDGQFFVSVTVMQTWQLEWWLLGQADKIKICEPLWLRDQIRAKLSSALAQY